MSRARKGWRRVKFGEVVRLVTDRCDPVATGIQRFVGLEHIEPADLRVRSWGLVAEGTTFTNRFRAGHVLFGKRRAYQRKVAVADFVGVCSGDIYVFESRNPATLHPELLPFLCQTDDFFEHAVGTSAGSLSPRTSWTRLAEYECALPPTEVQRAYVRIVSATQSVLDSLRDAIEQGKRTRASLLAHLYRHGTRSEAVQRTPIGVLPRSWGVEPLGNRFDVQLGKMVSEEARKSAGPIPYIRNANVQWNRLDLSDVARMSFTRAEREKFQLRYGDILACEGRHVGKSAMWRDEIPGACYQKSLHRLRPLHGDVPEFLLHCLAFYSVSGRFRPATGETTIPHLPAERLRAMLFPFPSRDEQREISDRIQSADDGLHGLQRRLDAALKVYRGLLRGLEVE